jgi:hypothetical protein
MDEAIERARVILTWPDDWDGEGSPAYQEETLEAAARFLAHGHGRGLPEPQVWAGPDGSVDISWHANGLDVLINVPPAGGSIGFSGEAPGATTQGEYTQEDDPSALFDWLSAVSFRTPDTEG